MGVNVNEIDQLFGMFGWSHINYWIDTVRDNLTSSIPSLTDLTTRAIDMLAKDKDGYFLLVEGGRIDHGHHGNEARRAISETVEFSKAIQAAVDTVNLDETLIVVSADHGHVMTISGYAVR
jgi:alkaline phosphatase